MKISQLEDLSNDLFLEIFDYIHAIDLLTGFDSLNNRFSSILSLTKLHIVVVSQLHDLDHLKKLSLYLIQHANQVISLSLEDQLHDLSSVIFFLFNQHTFPNLRSCIFNSISSSTVLEKIIPKLQNSNQLISFRIQQSKEIFLSNTIKQVLSQTLLTHRSSQLRSVELKFSYDYPKLVTYLAKNSTITLLHMNFHATTNTCSVYNLLPILRHYQALRILRITISNDKKLDSAQRILPVLPATYGNNPPVSPSIRTFHLNIQTWCDFRSLNFLLSCMPNLRRFIVTSICTLSWRKDMFDGYLWAKLLRCNTPCLDVFDIFLHVENDNSVFDLDDIFHSFEYFQRIYDDWYMALHRLQTNLIEQNQKICFRGFRELKKVRNYIFTQTRMVLGTIDVHSRTRLEDQHHLFYSDFQDLHIKIPRKMRTMGIPLPGQLFQEIEYLLIEIDSSALTFTEDLLDLFHLRRPIPEIDQIEQANQLAALVDLTRITRLEIQPKDDVSHLHFIKEILLASSNLTQLTIGNELLFSSILYDNPSLIFVFNRLQFLKLFTKNISFPLKYAPKIVQHFPALIHLELQIYSVDLCPTLVNILLDGLPKLIHLKIHFAKNTLLRNENYFINYVIQRRRQAYPDNFSNTDQVWMEITRQIMNIYFSGCSICANKKLVI